MEYLDKVGSFLVITLKCFAVCVCLLLGYLGSVYMIFKDDLGSNSPFSGKALPNLGNALNQVSAHMYL